MVNHTYQTLLVCIHINYNRLNCDILFRLKFQSIFKTHHFNYDLNILVISVYTLI